MRTTTVLGSLAVLSLAGVTTALLAGTSVRGTAADSTSLPTPTVPLPATQFTPSLSVDARADVQPTTANHPTRAAQTPSRRPPSSPSSAAPTPSSPRPHRSTPASRTSAPATTARPSTVSTSTAPAGGLLPLPGSTGTATQVITVRSAAWGNTRATLQAWTKVAGGWRQYGPSVGVWLGDQGMTAHPSESLDATPVGDFSITQTFGILPNPGTSLPYFHVDSLDWWVSDPTSSVYNTHQRCSTSCPFNPNDGEHLIDAGYVYNYAIVINANMNPVVKGAGSAFFLHVTNNQPTAGCVSMPSADIVRLLRWLTPSAHPRLIMGVG